MSYLRPRDRGRRTNDGRRGAPAQRPSSRALTPSFLTILALAGLFAAGCATTAPAPQPLTTIAAVEPREMNGKTEIIIAGSQPILQYTSFQLTEPLRLVVDMTDVELGRFQERLVVNKGLITDITPSQMDNIARLEIGLSQSAGARVYQASGKLVIELGKPLEAAAEQAKPAPAAPPGPTAEAGPPAAPQPEPEAPAGPAATRVTGVKATAGRDGVKVVITANGVMAPKTFMLKDNRLVVDIPGTRSAVRPTVIPVRKGGLDKVRVAQHPDKVRVVMDLTRPLEYASTPRDNQVIVALAVAAAPAEEAAPAERAAPEAPAAPGAAAPSEQELPSAPPAAAAPAVPAVPPVSPVRREASALQPFGEPAAAAPSKYTGKKISLDLQDADLVNVLRLFAELSNMNMILSPEVRGRVTVRMVNVPWDQAMDIILKMNGLGHLTEDNVMRIASQAALAREADEAAKAKEAHKKAEDLITRIVAINYTTAAAIEGTIKKSLSARGETTTDARTNTIIIKDIPQNVDEVATLIRLLDKPTPQVMIEARIVEATTTFSRDIGVQWGGTYTASAAYGNATGLWFPNSIAVTGGPTMGTTPSGSGRYFVNLPAAAGPGAGGAMGFSFGSLNKALNLDLVLSALESTGEGKVISQPRVSALDNKEAKIEQGQSIPYQSVSSSGTQVQFIDAQLSLTVTPHITPDNKVFMKITAQRNSPDTSLTGAGGQPSIRKNQATTEILLSDGETAVIGGILISERGYSIQKVPFLGDLPLIGWLFKKKSTNDIKRELLIFITPKVVKQEGVV